MSEFVGAGKAEGMQLWRIEQLKVVPIAEVNGKFHTGDSYILLKTNKSKSGALSWCIHFWLGEETSQDEAGIAAYKTVELDDFLGGGPVQYREVQGSESSLFLSYFKNTGGIEYLPGGVESGFRKVERDVYTTRLLHLKGKRTVKVTEVPIQLSSLNKGDVFILDMGLTLFIFNGESANKYEKAKGIDVATKINSDERHGRAQIKIINDDIKNEEFWNHFGGFVDPSSLPEGESDDEVVVTRRSPKLYHICDASGQMVVEEVAANGGKLSRDLLDENDVYIVIGSTGKVFLWVGKGSTLAEKKEAMPRALEFMKEQGIAMNTAVERVSQNNETAAFKSEFALWTPPQNFQFQSKTTSSVDTTVDVKELLSRKSMEEGPMVDNGSGKIQIWVVHDFKKVEVPESKYGQFHSGDSYLILYTYKKTPRSNEEYLLYFWLGRDSTADEKGAAALLAKELDDSMGGRPVQVRVVQGKEPAHFRQLFQGRMIIHSGGHASGFKNRSDLAVDSYDVDGVALFHVKGTTALNTMAIQVPEVASSLNSDDCFILVNPMHVYAWNGRGSREEEKSTMVKLALILQGDYLNKSDRELVMVMEGQEPAEFWDALGGAGEYPSRGPGELVPQEARLFHASTATGRFQIEEVENFDQTDLNDEDVFLLDTFTQLFVWIGSQSTTEEKEKALEFAQKYVVEAEDGRDPDMPILRVQAGSEPSLFTCQFQAWDADYWNKQAYQDPYAARLAALQQQSASKTPLYATSKLRSTPQTAKLLSTPPPSPSPSPSPSRSSCSTSSPATSSSPLMPPTPPSSSTTSSVLYLDSSSNSFDYDTLKSGCPEGVDPTQKEQYLTEDVFQSLFGMSKAAFMQQVKWKRDQKKKTLGLF